MIRLLLRLFGIRDFEPNESISVLKEQLLYERARNKELTETLLNIIHPKVVESAPVEINPIQQTTLTFSRKRAMLEAKDREEARIKKLSTNLGKPDDSLKSVENLEAELGIEEKTS